MVFTSAKLDAPYDYGIPGGDDFSVRWKVTVPNIKSKGIIG